jgi:hypothetical protein
MMLPAGLPFDLLPDVVSASASPMVDKREPSAWFGTALAELLTELVTGEGGEALALSPEMHGLEKARGRILTRGDKAAPVKGAARELALWERTEVADTGVSVDAVGREEDESDEALAFTPPQFPVRGEAEMTASSVPIAVDDLGADATPAEKELEREGAPATLHTVPAPRVADADAVASATDSVDREDVETPMSRADRPRPRERSAETSQAQGSSQAPVAVSLPPAPVASFEPRVATEAPRAEASAEHRAEPRKENASRENTGVEILPHERRSGPVSSVNVSGGAAALVARPPDRGCEADEQTTRVRDVAPPSVPHDDGADGAMPKLRVRNISGAANTAVNTEAEPDLSSDLSSNLPLDRGVSSEPDSFTLRFQETAATGMLRAAASDEALPEFETGRSPVVASEEAPVDLASEGVARIVPRAEEDSRRESAAPDEVPSERRLDSAAAIRRDSPESRVIEAAAARTEARPTPRLSAASAGLILERQAAGAVKTVSIRLPIDDGSRLGSAIQIDVGRRNAVLEVRLTGSSEGLQQAVTESIDSLVQKLAVDRWSLDGKPARDARVELAAYPKLDSILTESIDASPRSAMHRSAQENASAARELAFEAPASSSSSQQPGDGRRSSDMQHDSGPRENPNQQQAQQEEQRRPRREAWNRFFRAAEESFEMELAETATELQLRN